MQMHKLMIAVLAAASLMTACSDETKDKSKEAAASAAKDVKEAGAAAMDSAKEHVHDAATSVANATAPAAEGDKPAENK